MIRKFIIGVVLAVVAPIGAVASPAQEAAIEQLNQRNIHFGEVEYYEAVERGDSDIVRIFLQAGMSPDTKLGGRPYPIHIAAIRGFDRMTGFLIDAGTWVDLPDKNGYTALMFASAMAHAKTIEILLTRGADPNLKCHLDTTAMFLAVQARAPEIVKMLLEAGGDPIKARAGGESPLTLALKLEEKETLDLFAKRGHKIRIAEERKRIEKIRKDEEAARLKREAEHAAKLQRLQDAALGKDGSK